MWSRRSFLSGLFLLSAALIARAQAPYQPADGLQSVRVGRIEQSIRLDGRLEEAVWQRLVPARKFWQQYPADSIQNPVQTEVYFLFDDEHLYIGARCYSTGSDYVIPSLRRDYNASGSDNITFLLDTYADQTNAMAFGINPYGVRREALVANGGDDWDSSWDNKWKGEASIHDGYWECELAIPFSTLRFKKGLDVWNFQSYRFDMQTNTVSSWQPIPTNQNIANLAYVGKMLFEEAPKSKGGKVALIPYVAGDYSQDMEEGSAPDWGGSVGGDAKIAITPSLNLDLTVNPDFSQVEVDEQVINLDRFEIFFPERRQFFIENADLFSQFGFFNSNPFFSRRIGIGRDTATGQIVNNPIYYGARLSGKIDKNWRIGLLNMQTAKDEANGRPGYNYSVLTTQHKVFGRSNIGAIFVNKQAVNYDPETAGDFTRFNRVLGLDYNLNTLDNTWTGKAYVQRSFSETNQPQPWSHGAFLEYRVRKISASWEHQWIGEGFDAETGFVPRTNFGSFSARFQYFMYPDDGLIAQHGPGIRSEQLWTPGVGLTDRSTEVFWDFNWRADGGAFASLQNDYIYLLEPFDPTRTGAAELPADTGYTFTSLQLFIRNPPKKKFHLRFSTNLGQYFNGWRYGATFSLTWRYQPLGFITLDTRYQYIDLPDPFAQAGLFLIGPRIDFTFTKNIFFTTFIQYNSQAENVNINARFQWRYAPVSDFFLVYTDNYTTGFDVRNRAIVAKLTYWLNL